MIGMIGNTRIRSVLVAGLIVVSSTPGCGGGGGGGSGNSNAGTTTTFADSSTTTTLDGNAELYTITFDLDDAATIAAIQLEVDYADAGGEFVGSAGAVSCTSLVVSGGVLASFHDVDASSQLNFAAISGAGFTGPTPLARCSFAASGSLPAASDFVVTVVEANAPGLAPIVPLPTVSVSAIAPQ
jgi:predicted ribosomally synthesized peptide with SipW-like signal peptide